ncbi:heavy-metal-associated domain-containing protein [Maritimibacter sp. DP1N21-5]|uniref:heavy-metal-associated domain-containing protein n=1 Tax=Maritimibacter sp. DP1N21-5 TaxID=2836867 RepID=UPI001C438766|nr:heavy-metal-associated domain-containing protein [Maritimibacter sp. DP1N21-5]MBV7408239.1 heavy-metal-associated domain-containing protein [Maritimibacter sp. DP1N21-5]
MTETFSVPDMHCGKCRAKIEDALLDVDEGAALDFDMEAREVTVDSTLGTKAIQELIQAAGYAAVQKP